MPSQPNGRASQSTAQSKARSDGTSSRHPDLAFSGRETKAGGGGGGGWLAEWFGCCFSREPLEEEPPPDNRPEDRQRKGSVDRANLFLAHGQSEDLKSAYELAPGHLGKGGFGIVRKAHLRGTTIVRAIKEVRKRNLAADKTVQHEIAILRQLDHPCICRVLETYHDAKRIYIVLEYIEGRELFDEVEEEITKKGKFDERRAASIMRQVFGALQYCHGHHVIHRDLKPENIMVCRGESGASFTSPAIKIIDFGLAVLAKYNDRYIRMEGTMAYSAPEVMAGRCTAACDLWSTGIVIHVMLLGRFPDPIEMPLGQIAGVKISEEVVDLIEGLLQEDPFERLTAAQAVKHKWLDDRLQLTSSQQLRLSETTEAFVSFYQTDKLRQAALTALATQLTGQHVDQLREQFRLTDTNCDGIITREELTKAFAAAPPPGITDVEDWIENMFDQLDTDGSGEIEFTEWEAAAVLNFTHTEESLKAAFRVLDQDGSGTITVEDLGAVIHQTPEEIALWMMRYDANQDGEIDFSEFKELFTVKPVTPTSRPHTPSGQHMPSPLAGRRCFRGTEPPDRGLGRATTTP